MNTAILPPASSPVTLIGKFDADIQAITVPASSGSTVLLQGSLDNLPTTLTIEGETYTLALVAPRPGEFVVNPQTGELIVSLLTPVTTDTVAIASGAPTLVTDYLPPPYPNFLYQLPLTGSFSWTVSFEGHPSGSFTFDTRPELRSQVIQLLCEGAEFTAFGVGFRVSSLSFTEKSSVPNTIAVSVGLGGRHENYDFDVPYKGGGVTVQPGIEPDPNCAGKTPGGATTSSTKPYTTVSELAIKAGDLFSGPTMKVPYDKDEKGGTNFIAEAQKQVRIYESFLFYSDYTHVECRNLQGVGFHYLSPTQIKSDIQTTVTGRRRQASSFGGAFAHAELLPSDPTLAFSLDAFTPVNEDVSVYPWVKSYDPPNKLEGKFSEVEDTKKEDTQASSEYQKPKWKMRSPVRKTIKTPEEDPSIPPAGTKQLKDISLTFDNSGTEPKGQKTEVSEDDMPMETTEVTYGFAFLGKDMFSDDQLVGVSPGCWRKVRESHTVHHYDTKMSGPSRNTGYYLGSDTTGNQLVRYLIEGTELETTKLDSTDSIEGEMLKCYNYFTAPIVGAERYYLESKRDYYNDIPPPPLEYYKVCLPDGTSKLAYVEDPTWVDDFFAVTKMTRENSFSARSHPESDPPDDCKCPLTAGKEVFHKEWITVLPSDKTKKNPNIPIAGVQTKDNKDSTQDAFLTSTINYSSQDSQFVNSLAMAVSEKSYGRPPAHARKPSLLEKVEPEPENGTAATKSSTSSTTEYFVHSGINPDARLSEGGSLSYPAATTLQQALSAAQTDLTISNITGGTKESFQIEFNLTMKEGDLLAYSANNTIRTRRILSLAREVKIDSRGGTPILLGKSCSISLGIERRPPMFSSSKRSATSPKNGSDKPQEFTRLFVPDRWPLGEIINPDLPSRRNFSV